ncbi:hypothetical protein LZK73_11815 [Neorhizobium galegae]|nr:hypothetical protein LZK73_11815 [Neorhizobium galegae]
MDSLGPKQRHDEGIEPLTGVRFELRYIRQKIERCRKCSDFCTAAEPTAVVERHKSLKTDGKVRTFDGVADFGSEGRSND